MNKNLYKFFLSTIIFPLLLHSCKKSDDNINPGISYGITGVEPAMASSGDTIKVYGIGFQAGLTANTININGVAAKVTAASATEIDVIVPAAPFAGSISIQTGSKSFTYPQPFNVATVISGNQASAMILTPDKLYLLRGAVHFVKGAVLTIQAGTTIMAAKVSNAALVIDDGATLLVNGTVDKPVVFTSDQPINFRSPGDWTGITLAATTAAAGDILNYMRIEYAGFHLPDVAGAALLVNRSTGSGKIQYIQSSYSAGDGFRCNGAAGTSQYLKYLVAFGCAGNDFDFGGGSRVIAQFLLGLKDPLYADQFGADGLLVQSSQPVTISNLTLMGPDGLARNAVINQPNYNFYRNYDDILNTHAGRGVHIGRYDYTTGSRLDGTLQLFNSLVAASWLAGISLDGPSVFSKYANGADGSIIKYCSLTYTLATSFNTLDHDNPPLRGYLFSGENLSGITSGFAPLDSSSVQSLNFNRYNDSLKLMLATPFITAVNPNATYDELGIANMALYSKLTNPLMIPANGSGLLTGAVFSDSQLNDSFFSKAQTFRGAFGPVDWTKSWANYGPQQTSYN